MKNPNKLIMKLTGLAFVFLMMVTSTNAQVLDLESTTEGALLPRMTTAQRTAIVTPSPAEMVYDTDTKSFWYYDGMVWGEIGDGGSGGPSFFDCGVGMSGDTIRNTLPAVRDTITLTSTEMITAETHVSICIDLDHTYVGDLSVRLISPGSGATIGLVINEGVNADNFKQTCFTSTAKKDIDLISSSDAPFSDVYIPEESLDALIGLAINGDWTLEVEDGASGDDGILNTWELNVSNDFSVMAQNALYAYNSFNAVKAQSVLNLIDNDNDTKVQVEESADEDVIRFDVSGTELMTLSKNAGNHLVLQPKNSFFNTFIGENAGLLLGSSGQTTTLIGHSAGASMTSSAENTIIGSGAGSSLVGTNGNTFVGRWAGRDNTGSSNVIIGNYAGLNSGSSSSSIFIGQSAGQNETNNNRLYIDNSNTANPLIYGEFDSNRIGIGTSSLATGYTLSVDGKISCEEVLVDLSEDWPDYVFLDDYKLKPLEEVEAYINEKGHLPNVPSANEIESNGLELGEINRVLMEKIEELTLYILDQEKRMKVQDAKIQELVEKIEPK